MNIDIKKPIKNIVKLNKHHIGGLQVEIALKRLTLFKR